MIVLGAVAAVASVLAVAAVVVLVRRLRRPRPSWTRSPRASTTLEDDGRRRRARSAALAEASSNTLTDESTGLFSQEYFDVALDARLSAARRHLRPVAVVLIEVVEGLADGSPRPGHAPRRWPTASARPSATPTPPAA